VCSGPKIEDYMHAIIETGGKQYRVAPGDVVRVEKLAGEAGSEIELPVKAAFNDGGELIPGGTLKATILGEGRGDKVLVFKFKRKKQYKKTIGHRQSFTEVKVGEIQGAEAGAGEAPGAEAGAGEAPGADAGAGETPGADAGEIQA
jgi:large subunit ribosomal protein L21